MRGKKTAKACIWHAAGAVVLLSAASSHAGLSFSGSTSTASFTHDPDITSTSDLIVVRSPSVVPSSSNMPAPPSYHIHDTYPAGAVSPEQNTYAVGSIGQVTNATTASFVLIAGSGITQEDPSGTLGASQLTLDVDLRWNVTSGGFTPSTAYASIPVGFNIGAGGSGFFSADLLWSVGSGGSGSFRWTPSQKFGPGKSAQTFTTPAGAILGDGSQPAGALVRLRGKITFQADNELAPSSVFPINAEVGTAPVSYTYQPNLSGGGLWTDGANWVPDPGNKSFANGLGERARFMNGLVVNDGTFITPGPQTVQLTSHIDLGTLDIDSDQPYTFAGTDGSLSFVGVQNDKTTTPTVLNVRNLNGNAAHELRTNVGLTNALNMIVDSTGGVLLSRSVFGAGGIIKSGQGPAELSSPGNTYSGGTQIEEGGLTASATGALGTGAVVVDGGTLNYNANGAADGSVLVNPGGFVNLGVTPNGLDHFNLSGGAIGGDPAVLGRLDSKTLTLAPGSMIVHQKFDADATSGNPAGIGASTPLYIFGVGADMSGNLQAGAKAKTPWIGLGGDPGTHTFGGTWNVQGAGELRVLGGGTLKIAADILGGPSDSIDKTGSGTASIESTGNDFAGAISVSQGLFQVNSALKPSSLTVNPGGSLGGHGIIDGPVIFKPGDGSVMPHLAPGGSIGVLTVGSLNLQNDTQLDYELDTPGNNDMVQVNGPLVLDGILNLADGDFGPGIYTLMHFNGALTDNGLEMGQATPIYNYKIYIDDSGDELGANVRLAVTEVVPEPAGMGLLAVGGLLLIRRRR